MYNTSTQRKFWLYGTRQELEDLRQLANKDYIKRRQEGEAPVVNEKLFLTYKEEIYYTRHNLNILRDVCKKFQPPMLKCVIGTAFQYFKRFYLNNSCMEYLPKNIAVTCAYLACKVEEFNININQFVANLKGDSARAADIVLSNEMLLMQKLKYHLTVHNPYRAIEGLMIDLKARGPEQARPRVEELRPHIEDYTERLMFTDACFLFTPSQIALASIIEAAQRCQVSLEPYLSVVLFESEPSKLAHMARVCQSMKELVTSQDGMSPSKETIKTIEKKLKQVQLPETDNANRDDQEINQD